MPRSISSLKAHRQSLRRAAVNKARKTLIKSEIRKVKDAAEAKDVAAAEKLFREAAGLLDRNANRRTIHRNTAARRKSRLAKQINLLKSARK